MKTNARLPLLLALTHSVVTLHAQERQVSPGLAEVTITGAAAGTYRVGLQDDLKVTVFDEPELSAIYRVDSDGAISFPLIGQVAAAGEALALAGSPMAGASTEVIVVRPTGGDGPQPVDSNPEGTRLTVNRKDLELGKAGHDVMLQDGTSSTSLPHDISISPVWSVILAPSCWPPASPFSRP
jgi:polysaccharide biosynthesis/export protein